jgi:two-component system, chemotaxis family, protein-glutamate methylesterase/glutaminase
MQRPCINAMFRSAAAAYRERVVGVLLTGLLDDGAAGLWEIQQQNGTTIVQDPSEATFRSMPDSAIRSLNVQYIERLRHIGPLLTKLAMSEPPEPLQFTPSQQTLENTTQTCPECGGAMGAVTMGTLREYRCHTGHRLGLETMIEQKARNIERILEVALAQSEELSDLLERASENAEPKERERLAAERENRGREQSTLRGLTNSNETAVPTH